MAIEKAVMPIVLKSPCPAADHTWQVVGTWPGYGVDPPYRHQQIDLVCSTCWRMSCVKPVRLNSGKWDKVGK